MFTDVVARVCTHQYPHLIDIELKTSFARTALLVGIVVERHASVAKVGLAHRLSVRTLVF
jgi:hypothetical protein